MTHSSNAQSALIATLSRRVALTCTALLVMLACVCSTYAGDTITVKTLTFSDITKRSGTWLFPPAQRYEKILMEYTLKCDPLTPHDKYDCGEWDYLTYIFVTDSSGTVDSTRVTTPFFSVHRRTPATFTYSDVSSASSLQPDSVHRIVSRTSSFVPSTSNSNFTVNSGTASLTEVVQPNGFRGQFRYTAQELLAKGLKKGQISRIALQASGSDFTAAVFAIRLRTDSSGRLDTLGVDAYPMLEVFLQERVVITHLSPKWLDFYSIFNWDGKSDIIVDISAEKVEAGSGSLLASLGGDGLCISSAPALVGLFEEGDEIELPASIGTAISNEITVTFWCRGDTVRQPKATSVLEAWDSQGRRVLNVHLPWDNGRVYWDAGITPADGTNDRVEKDAPPVAWEGRWNHWAFVKNSGTGLMRVFLNGSMFMEKTDAFRSMNSIERFVLGSGSAGSFPGSLMHLAVLGKALDSNDIRSIMTQGRQGVAPGEANLLAYYAGFPPGPNRVLLDESGAGRNAKLFGLPTATTVYAMDWPLGGKTLAMRPVIGFSQDPFPLGVGSLTRHWITTPLPLRYTDVVRNSREIVKRIYPEDSIAAMRLPTDTLLVIECFPEVVTYVDWNLVVTAPRKPAPPVLTMTNGEHTFFSPIVNFEIGRYITPYGIGLSLGDNGFKWVFDVTDYAQLLHDNVTFSAGNGQELIDVTFKMIKGVPVRDVEQLDQIYSVRDGSYAEILAGRLLTPEVVNIEPSATTHRLKTRTTGHRFGEPSNCAEFCQRNHQLFVDGTKRFEWLLWNECASNPVYPQGGTWVIDRAGWCPGAPVDVYDHEATPFALGKDSILVDYAVEGDEWNGSQGVWDVTTQFVGYSAPNHALDASIDEVVAPTNWEFYQRVNPICGEPVVVLRNSGSTDLTSCTITYGAEGAPMQTYTWNGFLRFLERDTITLPAPQWPATTEPPATEGQHTFIVKTSAPNGGVDEYTDNDTYQTQFVMPPLWYRDFEIALRTNNQASVQYTWILRKLGGDTIGSGRNLSDNTTYSHKYTLEDGCYEFKLDNVEGYGLDLWFVRSQLGTGHLSFKSLDNTFKTFNPDFGNTAWMQFRVGNKPTLLTNTDVLIFNHPTLDKTTRQLRITPENNAGVYIDSLTVFNLKKHFTLESTSHPLPLQLPFGDTLVVTVAYLRDVFGVSAGSLRIHSNDERQLTKTIKLVGEAGATSVEDDFNEDAEGQHANEQRALALFGPELQVVPNPSDGNATLLIDRAAHIRVIDAIGLIVFETFATGNGAVIIPLPDLSSGTYTIVAEAGRTLSTLSYVVVR